MNACGSGKRWHELIRLPPSIASPFFVAEIRLTVNDHVGGPARGSFCFYCHGKNKGYQGAHWSSSLEKETNMQNPRLNYALETTKCVNPWNLSTLDVASVYRASCVTQKEGTVPLDGPKIMISGGNRIVIVIDFDLQRTGWDHETWSSVRLNKLSSGCFIWIL